MSIILVTILAMIFSSALSAGDAPVAGVYSSMYYDSNSGDINGKEIKIVPTFEGLYISIHCGPGIPTVVPLIDKGEGYHFILDEKQEDALCGMNTFHIKAQKKVLYYG